ncbi:MAG: arginine--tRNA ligase, partial [Microgenomates group bacterium]
EMEEEARKWFKKLEEGDSEARAIWQACVDISLKEFDRIYKLLGVKIDIALGESFYLDKMDEVLEDCRKKGILKESQGAQVVEIPGMKVPAMLVKSDGATTYLLRDLAAIKYRVKTWRPDLIVYEVGADQSLHFRQLFNLAVQLGYGNLNMFVHVAHGLIRWPTGKFSTRSGKTIHLEEVLKEAIERAKKLSEGTNASTIVHQFVLKDSEKVAKAVGIGAIKYNDLKQNPRTDIIFDWDQILTLNGNSGPYLQYTYARTQSVLRKVQSQTAYQPAGKLGKVQCFSNETMKQLNNEEMVLLRTIYRFPEVVEESAKQFSPNLLCNFLFDLAQKFNLFYDKHRILSQKSKFKSQKVGIESENEVTEEQSNFRLVLTAAVGQVLKNGLGLLGIEALKRM